MSTKRTTTGGLSTADVEGIRESLAAGRKPKVMFTEAAGQIAGEVGQVVKLADPDESDEWVVVRFGRDELPFAPADLVVPPRGQAGGKRTPAAKTAGATPTTPDSPPGGTSAGPTGSSSGAGAGARSGSGSGSGAGSRSGPTKRTAKPARAAKSKAPSTLTVTLAYESGEWTVAAHQGSKTLAKPYVVRPAEALKMVSMLDVPGVHDAVEAIVSAEVTEASQRAEQLRNELAEVEARLSELRTAGG